MGKPIQKQIFEDINTFTVHKMPLQHLYHITKCWESDVPSCSPRSTVWDNVCEQEQTMPVLLGTLLAVLWGTLLAVPWGTLLAVLWGTLLAVLCGTLLAAHVYPLGDFRRSWLHFELLFVLLFGVDHPDLFFLLTSSSPIVTTMRWTNNGTAARDCCTWLPARDWWPYTIHLVLYSTSCAQPTIVKECNLHKVRKHHSGMWVYR